MQINICKASLYCFSEITVCKSCITFAAFSIVYTTSEYTQQLAKGNKKKLTIKNRAAGFVLDAITAAYNKKGPEPVRHKNRDQAKNARKGVYRYKTTIGFAVKNENGDIVDYNVYNAQMVVLHSSNNKLTLYDIIDIEKDNETGKKLLSESAHGQTKLIRHPSVANQKITQRAEKSKAIIDRWEEMKRKATQNQEENKRSYSVAMDQENETHPGASQFSVAQLAQANGMRFDENEVILYNNDNQVIDGVKVP